MNRNYISKISLNGNSSVMIGKSKLDITYKLDFLSDWELSEKYLLYVVSDGWDVKFLGTSDLRTVH